MPPWLSSPPVSAQSMATSPYVTPGHFEDEKQQILAPALNHRTHFTSQAKGRMSKHSKSSASIRVYFGIQGGKLAGLSMRGQDHTQDWSHFKILCFDWEAMAQIFVSIPVLENPPLMSVLTLNLFFEHYLSIQFLSKILI